MNPEVKIILLLSLFMDCWSWKLLKTSVGLAWLEHPLCWYTGSAPKSCSSTRLGSDTLVRFKHNNSNHTLAKNQWHCQLSFQIPVVVLFTNSSRAHSVVFLPNASGRTQVFPKQQQQQQQNYSISFPTQVLGLKIFPNAAGRTLPPRVRQVIRFCYGIVIDAAVRVSLHLQHGLHFSSYTI